MDVTDGDYGFVLELDDGTRLTVNATNGRKLEKAYGDDTDLWADKTVELTRGETKYRDEMVATTILTPVSPELSKEQQVALLPKRPDPMIDDDIPF